MLSTAEIAERYAWPTNDGKPWVRTNFVATVDGASQDVSGLSGGFGGPDDHKIFHVLRSTCDVILVGSGTARSEGYWPVRPEEVHAELRTDRASEVPVIAVVSESLNINQGLVDGHQILVTHLGTDPSRRAELAETMDVIAVGDTSIDWPAALAALAERGLQRVLCEGGPSLHGTLVVEDLVDEVCLTIAHLMAAGQGLRIATGSTSVARAMKLADQIPGDGMIAMRWTRDRSAD